jgi:hypothetical protein
VESSAGPLFTGGNFGGIIQAGECGDVDEYLRVTGGRVSVFEPNLERCGMAGGCAVRMDGTGGPGVFWHGGRISNITLSGGDAGTAALFRVNAAASKGGTLHITGAPSMFNEGWRDIEVYGASPDGVKTFSTTTFDSRIIRTHTSTEGGAAVIAFPIGLLPVKTSGASFTPVSNLNRGLPLYAPSDSGGDSLLVAYRTPQGTYKNSAMLNDRLIQVLADTATAITNSGTGATTLFTHTVPANFFTSAKQKARFRAFGTFAANANNKQITLDWGGVTIYDSGSLAINANSWEIEGIIVRNGGGTFHSVVNAACDDALLVNRIQTTKDITRYSNQNNALNIKGTGGATGDIELLFAELFFMKSDSEY